jgi:hypothetical protein
MRSAKAVESAAGAAVQLPLQGSSWWCPDSASVGQKPVTSILPMLF